MGVLSFGLAYACFYKSIAALGVAQTALIGSFWPIASLAIASKFVFNQTVSQTISWQVIVAAVALLAGAVLQILA